jgi:DNA helicase-2/ATP-dependent DNA helicase PcrA
MNSLLDTLNERQCEAVLHTQGPLIVLAGAGSGKTKMLTSRIAYLIHECKVSTHQILAVTFTNKAAAEMRERVQKTLHKLGSGYLLAPEIGTFHSVCVRLLRREMDKTPFTQSFVIYDDSDQLSLIKTVMKNLQIDEKAFNPKAIQGGINRAKCDAQEPEDLVAPAHNLFARQLKRVYEQYQKDLFKNNAVDFGEIICLTYRLLRDFPDLREKYQRRFQYIHVDEYQDTNRAQYLLLSMLASKRFGGHENICVVGDEDQSIYKWRGADIRNILDFEKDYPGAHIVKLEENYRSTQTILSVAGSVIRNNKQRKDKTLWTQNPKGQKVIRAQVADERVEAEMVVSEVKRVAEHEHRAYSDFAIFYRTNAQSRQFEDVLRREKIPYQIVGGLRFYDRKEIKDILSYFKAILNPTDSISLKRVINVPARGIGKTTLEKLDQYHASQPQMSYWDVLREAAQNSSLTSAGTAKKISQFVALIDRLIAKQPTLRVSELYHLILDDTGYVRSLRDEATEEALSRIENLEEFDTLLQEFEEDQLGQLNEKEQEDKKKDLLALFIEQSALASEVDQGDAQGSSVKLMTLHSSKGLEFPVVFLVGMEEGLFPSIKPWEETPEEDIEEERRLCYVGMTRAREVLYLLNVVVRRLWGNVSYQEPSRFFSEVPTECIEHREFAPAYSSSQTKLGSSRHLSSVAERVYDSSFHSQSPWVGRRMNHPEYGPGTVISDEGSGDAQKVTIQFTNRDQRKFLLKYVENYF